jgi:hypothetical protein
VATYRYTIILDRTDDEDYGREVGITDGHDGSDLGARQQVAKELQAAADVTGLPVGTFDVIKREKIA